MKITGIVIKDGCTACGLCAEICPEVFKVTDKVGIKDIPGFEQYEKKIMAAVSQCPAKVIKVI